MADDGDKAVCPLCWGRGFYEGGKFRRHLTALRKASGWSLKDLARRSLIGGRDLLEIEFGERPPTGNELARLARGFRLELSALVGGKEIPAAKADKDGVRPTVTKSDRRRAQRETTIADIEAKTAAYKAAHPEIFAIGNKPIEPLTRASSVRLGRRDLREWIHELRAAREAKGLTFEQVAKAAGCSANGIALLERGEMTHETSRPFYERLAIFYAT